MMDAPADEAVARVPLARQDTLHGTALVLQVYPLPGTTNHNKLYYDAFGNIELGDFTVARAFFIHHGHTVVYHDCFNAIAFQELYPLATIGYISSLLHGLIAKGHELLEAQHRLLQAAAHAPPPITPPWSILDCYVAADFGTARGVPLLGMTSLLLRPPLPSHPHIPALVLASFGPIQDGPRLLLRLFPPPLDPGIACHHLIRAKILTALTN
jgi:hypothetical protein